MEESTKKAFEELLELGSSWQVSSVNLSSDTRLDIEISYCSEQGKCPDCGKECRVRDLRKTREWRHLNTMQYETYLHSRIPRVRCSACQKTISVEVPWAESRNGLTLLFENHAIDILTISRSVEEARKHLNISWYQLNNIRRCAVERGLSRRKPDIVETLGIDEKSYAKGHVYTSILNDLKGGRVIDLVAGKKQEDAKKLIKQGLNEEQRASVKAVAIDMCKSFQNAIEATLPKAKVVHDVFHIAKHLNDAVDKTRRWEHKMLLRDSNKSLTGLKFEFLRNSEKLDEQVVSMFKDLDRHGYQTAKAWHFKELFRNFWKLPYKSWARRFFESWYNKIIHSNIKHMKKVAKMLKKRIDNVLNYFSFRITNAQSEGLNSKIQTVQSNSRGFRSFANLRTAVLFYCGKLDMKHVFAH